MTAPFRPREIFAALERHRVDYVAVGGFALIAHGVLKVTADVDIVPEPGGENLARLAAALQELEGVPDGEPDTSIDVALLARDTNMRFQTAAGQLDVLHARQYADRYHSLRARAVQSRPEGILVTVAARKDLIALKAASGRDRDLIDIGDLLAIEDEDQPDPAA